MLRPILLLWCCYLAAGLVYDYPNCKNFDTNTNYRFYWDIPTNSSEIRFLIQAETAGWIGLGVSNGGLHPMISNGNTSDIFVGWVNPATPCSGGCLFDYYVNQYQQPSLDPSSSQSLTLLSANLTSGVLSMEFSRPLNTGDSTFDRVIDPSVPVNFIWALNPTSRALPPDDGITFVKHNPDTKGVVVVDLLEPSVCITVPKEIGDSISSPDGLYRAAWLIDETDSIITFTLTAQTKGWVGIGLGSQDSMLDADVYVGWVNEDGTGVLTDRYTTAYSMPSQDTDLGGTTDSTLIYANKTEVNGTTTTVISFSRKLKTGDKFDRDVTFGTTNLLWAYGDDDSVDEVAGTFQQHTAKGYVLVNLYSGCRVVTKSSTDELKKAHGIVMAVSICVLLLPGILLARYFKTSMRKWFHLHVVLQVAGVAGVLIAFALIIVAKKGIYISGYHQWCGIFVIGGFCLQIFIGLLAHIRFDPNRTSTPVFPDMIHWWLGRATFLLSLATIYLGMSLLGAPLSAWIVYSSWLLVAVVFVIVMQYNVGQTHERPYVELEDTDVVLKKSRVGRIGKVLLSLFMAISVFLIVVGFVITINSTVMESDNYGGEFDLCINFDNFTVPNTETNYICKGFYLPNDQMYHAIQFKPKVDSQEMLHHMILYTTTNFVGEEYFDCSSMPDGSSPLWIWAQGGALFSPPDNVGFRIGKGAALYAALQVHYDNPNLWEDVGDSSGVTMTITPQLRPIDAAYFVTGINTGSIRIPSGLPYYEAIGNCSSDTTAKLPDASVLNPLTDNYTVFGSALHMHTLGRQIYTDHFRKNASGVLEKIGTIGCNDYFSFNDQSILPVNVTMLPGDELITHCIWDSSSKNTVTKGCEATDCEMCLNFLAYYPAKTSVSCGSNSIASSNTAMQPQCPMEV